MDKKIIKFDNTEIEKYKFQQHKSPISIDNIDIKKIVVSICLSVILIDSAYKKDKNFYPQVFLEEYKYVVKEKLRLSLLLTT